MAKAGNLILILAAVALSGCGGVSIKRTQAVNSLPRSVKHIAVIVDKDAKFVDSAETSWGSTVTRNDRDGMRQFFARLNEYSKQHDYGVVWTVGETSGAEGKLVIKKFEYTEKYYGGSGVEGFHAETSGGSVVQTNGGSAYGMASNDSKGAGGDSKLHFVCEGVLSKNGSKQVLTPFDYDVSFGTSTGSMDRVNHMFDSYPGNMSTDEQNNLRDQKVLQEKWDEIAKNIYSDLGF